MLSKCSQFRPLRPFHCKTSPLCPRFRGACWSLCFPCCVALPARVGSACLLCLALRLPSWPCTWLFLLWVRVLRLLSAGRVALLAVLSLPLVRLCRLSFMWGIPSKRSIRVAFARRSPCGFSAGCFLCAVSFVAGQFNPRCLLLFSCAASVLWLAPCEVCSCWIFFWQKKFSPIWKNLTSSSGEIQI